MCVSGNSQCICSRMSSVRKQSAMRHSHIHQTSRCGESCSLEGLLGKSTGESQTSPKASRFCQCYTRATLRSQLNDEKYS